MIGYNKSEIVGKMRERVILQNRIITQSDSGFQSEIYSDIGIYWSKIEYKTGFEEEDADKLTNQQKINITLRYNILVNVNSRFVYRNELYQVEKVEYSDDRRFMICVCVWRSSYTSIYAGSIFCSASLLAQSSLSAALMRVIKYQASLNAFGSVSADISFVQKVASSLNANALLISNLQLAKNVESSIAASSLFNSDLKIAKTFESSLNANGTLVSDLKIAKNAEALLDANASLTGDINFVQKVASSLNASSLLSGDISFVKNAEANLSALASLSGDINFVQKAQASLLTSASVTGSLTIPQLLNASLLATGTTTADLTVNAPSASLLLDLYPNAAAAYSLRKLRTAYTGSAVRVRRSSDNTEQDIGFVAGQLDTASLLAFCGVGNGFVTTWYDQSGNAKNVVQTTSASQPQIVSSGVVIITNNKPGINFGSNRFLIYNIGIVNTYAFTVSKVNTVAAGPIFQTNIISSGGGEVRLNAPNYYRAPSTLGVDGNDYVNTNGIMYFNGNIHVITDNAINQHLLSIKRGTVIVNNGFIMGISNTSRYYIGLIQEIVVYTSDQSSSRTGIETNINTHYAIY